MTETEDRLAVLRAQLAEAEAALEKAGTDGRKATVRAARAHHAAMEQALADFHVDAQRAEQDKPRVETRPVSPAPDSRPESEPEVHPEPETERRMSLMEMNQSASTQTVRGTHDLTPGEHARRRNPKHT